MTRIITLRSCASCAHKYRETGQLICRRFPPTITPITMQTPPGRPDLPPVQVIGYTTAFPQVSDQMFCSEYKHGILSDDQVA